VTFRPFKVKVIDFGANRKRICDFLLVRHSNLGPILHRFGNIEDFFVLLTPPLFHPNLGFLFLLHQIAHVGVSSSRGLKLFGREIISDVRFQPMWKSYLNVSVSYGWGRHSKSRWHDMIWRTERLTDRQTDDLLWHNRALRSIAR